MAQRQAKPNKRKSYRCPMDQTRQTGELKVRYRRRRVMIINQSAGGFGALSDRDLRVAVGDVLTLTTGGEQFDVRVAHVGQTGAIDPTGEARLVFRFGLERVKESEAIPGTWNGERLNWRSMLPSGGAAILFVVLTATAALGVLAARDNPLVRQVFHRRPRPDPPGAVIAESLSPTAERVAERLQSRAGPSLEPEAADARRPASPEATHGTTTATPAGMAITIRKETDDVPRARILAHSTVAAELKLSAAQQAELRRISDAEVAALEELDRTAQTSNPADRAAKRAMIRERFHREALQSLTPEQRLLWRQRAGINGEGEPQ